jgi:hypothetical protein
VKTTNNAHAPAKDKSDDSRDHSCEYAIRYFQANQEGLKLNVTYQLLIYADDANLLGESLCTVKKNTEALLTTINETGLEHGLTTMYGNGPNHYCGLVLRAARGRIT